MARSTYELGLQAVAEHTANGWAHQRHMRTEEVRVDPASGITSHPNREHSCWRTFDRQNGQLTFLELLLQKIFSHDFELVIMQSETMARKY